MKDDNVKEIKWTLIGPEGRINYMGNEVCEAIHTPNGLINPTRTKFELKDLKHWVNKFHIVSSFDHNINLKR